MGKHSCINFCQSWLYHCPYYYNTRGCSLPGSQVGFPHFQKIRVKRPAFQVSCGSRPAGADVEALQLKMQSLGARPGHPNPPSSVNEHQHGILDHSQESSSRHRSASLPNVKTARSAAAVLRHPSAISPISRRVLHVRALEARRMPILGHLSFGTAMNFPPGANCPPHSAVSF